MGDQEPSEGMEIEDEAEALYSASEPASEEEEETLFEAQSSEALELANAVPPQLTIEHTVSESDEQRSVLNKAHLYCYGVELNGPAS